MVDGGCSCYVSGCFWFRIDHHHHIIISSSSSLRTCFLTPSKAPSLWVTFCFFFLFINPFWARGFGTGTTSSIGGGVERVSVSFLFYFFIFFPPSCCCKLPFPRTRWHGPSLPSLTRPRTPTHILPDQIWNQGIRQSGFFRRARSPASNRTAISSFPSQSRFPLPFSLH